MLLLVLLLVLVLLLWLVLLLVPGGVAAVAGVITWHCRLGH